MTELEQLLEPDDTVAPEKVSNAAAVAEENMFVVEGALADIVSLGARHVAVRVDMVEVHMAAVVEVHTLAAVGIALDS